MVWQFVVAPETCRPQGLSHAVNVDGILVGKGDFAAQVGQVFSNLGEVLKAAGLSLDDVAFVNTYLTTWKNWWRLRDVRPKHLPEAQWAGTTVVAQMEDPDMLVGIELVAAASKEAVAVHDLYQVRSATSAAAHAVKVGNLTYVQGQIAWDRNDPLVGEGDIRAQAEQVYANMGAVLQAAGASLADVVKVNSYLPRWEDISRARQVRERYLPGPQLTSTTVLVPLIDPDRLIAAECIAVVE